VVLKILKILKVTSVEHTEKCFKTLTSRTKDGVKSESESEIAMCDRMQMYNIVNRLAYRPYPRHPPCLKYDETLL
jgi:hypothetical protein